VAEPVLLISSDPFLGASLEALADGRIRVARLDPARRPAAWPGEPAATVVLDVAAPQRDALHAWIRRHHQGPLVVLLKPGERAPGPGFDPAGVVVGRPFRLGDLVEVLEQPPARLSGHRPPVPALPAPPAPPPAARDPLRAGADRRRRRRARRGRRLAAQVLVGLLVVLLVLVGVWLALGLVEARRDLVVGAAALPWPTATLDLRG
jgi:hypothetical protein